MEGGEMVLIGLFVGLQAGAGLLGEFWSFLRGGWGTIATEIRVETKKGKGRARARFSPGTRRFASGSFTLGLLPAVLGTLLESGYIIPSLFLLDSIETRTLGGVALVLTLVLFLLILGDYFQWKAITSVNLPRVPLMTFRGLRMALVLIFVVSTLTLWV